MKTALVIMAAGIGSRFRGGIKQFTPVGPNGELIIDYSIHDAIEAGFNEIVFVTRREIEAQMREQIGDRIAALIGKVGNLTRVAYVHQEIDDVPAGFEELAAARAKPWGTGQAILACHGKVTCPFAVINADDYYGKQAFRDVHDFLTAHGEEKGHYCMAGFILKNTLSDFGTVSRGICAVDNTDYLTCVTETHAIEKTPTGARSGDTEIDPETPVSMNMWGFTPDFLDTLEAGFRTFLATEPGGEYLLPGMVGEQLARGESRVKCLRTGDSWFGVTYQEDRELARASIRSLIEAGVYPEALWAQP
ncbi:MAG: nucleotidyltransferase [Oscillospiraceae bacterium]|nr:nucleotidyltransferase [Oscillospiraceae bacterium]